MATNYPTSLDAYSTKADGVDDVLAQHVNNLQDAIVAIETQLALAAWSTFTPTLVQGGAVTKTVTWARYKIINKLCHMEIRLAVTGSGSAGNNIIIGNFPAAATIRNTGSITIPVGIGLAQDAGSALYVGFASVDSGTSVAIRDSATQQIVGTNPSFALASGDTITLNLTYEVA